MELKIGVVVMSGVEDGAMMEYDSMRGDGLLAGSQWTISIGRREENDICLRNDTYISRQHANLHRQQSGWLLEDCDSTNGTFLNNPEDFFNDQPVKGTVPLQEGQLFRVGRTWLRLQKTD